MKSVVESRGSFERAAAFFASSVCFETTQVRIESSGKHGPAIEGKKQRGHIDKLLGKQQFPLLGFPKPIELPIEFDPDFIATSTEFLKPQDLGKHAFS